ncbi:thioredoxin family protein [Roseiconus lacunae]|uniref:thioredoxin family protein n=1 Tax=Roseiconus lacunae TaxID=2605694 RepID=UPI001F28779E|nr:thioredoxin family protein [Roseiconus lacunae]
MKHILLPVCLIGTLVFLALAFDFGDAGLTDAEQLESNSPSEGAAGEAYVASKEATFQPDPHSGRGPKLVLMKFGAPWCPPCRMVDKELLDLKQAKLPVEVRKINVDQHQSLAEQYDVSSIPRLILTEDGEVIGDLVGYQSADQLESWIRENASERALSATEVTGPPAVYANPFFN